MNRNKLATLREERAAAYTAMQEALAESGDGAMSAETTAKYDAAERSFDDLDSTIQKHERVEARDRSMTPDRQERAADPERAAAQAAETRSDRFERALSLAGRSDANLRSFLDSAEYREAFAQGALRNLHANDHAMPAEYRAALNLGTSSEGGITAPAEFVAELLSEAADMSDVRQFAKLIQTSHGRDLEYPTLATKGSATWTTEVVASPDALKSEPTFGANKVLEAFPFQRECVTSKDLLQDSRLDIEALIRELIIESGGELESAAFITGNGSGKPTGIITGLTVGNVKTGATGQVTTITTDDLIDVQHKLKERYRANARWRFEDATLAVIRKLKDADGQYIWQPGLKEGVPSVLLGKPYSVDEYMPSMAASATSVVFGDHSGYWIRDVLELSITKLVETYARQRQIGFLADGRVDGKLMRPERFSAYKHPAS